jgi:hypothetical protein
MFFFVSLQFKKLFVTTRARREFVKILFFNGMGLEDSHTRSWEKAKKPQSQPQDDA